MITLATNVSPVIISAGFEDGLAIGSDGKLYAWGDNSAGQLGDGTTITHESPEVITLASGVLPTAISAGNGFSLAIGSDGKLYAWGTDGRSQLGDSMTTTQVQTPEAITLASGVFPTAISAGSYHSLAIGSDGKLYTWGDNSGHNLVTVRPALRTAPRRSPWPAVSSPPQSPRALSTLWPSDLTASSTHGALATTASSVTARRSASWRPPKQLAWLSGSALLPSPPATPTVLRSDPTATSMPGDTTQTASSVTVQPTTDPALR